MYKQKQAFTLAEVLITLGIIGIIAAMTLPALISNLQNKHFRIMWRKIYSDLSNATLLILEREPFIGNESEQKMANKYSNFLTNAKICEENKAVKERCWPDNKKIYQLNGSKSYNDIGAIGGGSTCMKLNNGAVLCFDSYIAIVDVNGSNAPNTIGRDIFAALIDKKKHTVYPAKGHRRGWGAADGILEELTTGDGDCQNADYGWGCSAEYLLSDK